MRSGQREHRHRYSAFRLFEPGPFLLLYRNPRPGQHLANYWMYLPTSALQVPVQPVAP